MKQQQHFWSASSGFARNRHRKNSLPLLVLMKTSIPPLVDQNWPLTMIFQKNVRDTRDTTISFTETKCLNMLQDWELNNHPAALKPSAAVTPWHTEEFFAWLYPSLPKIHYYVVLCWKALSECHSSKPSFQSRFIQFWFALLSTLSHGLKCFFPSGSFFLLCQVFPACAQPVSC